MKKTVNMKLRKGDPVVIIAGKEKGKRGEITKVSSANNKVVVAGLNMVKKTTKPNQQTGDVGGFVTKEAPIHASNVMLIDLNTQKPTRKRVG
jgi:large subunit ribosomal protein L24